MCIICKGEYNGETVLDCSGCTSLTSLPPLPNVTSLSCNGCTSLTSLPAIPNVAILGCYGCTSLTSIPAMPNMTYLDCYGCTSLTSLPKIHNMTRLYCDGCPWLDHSSNPKYLNNISRLSCLQRWYRRMLWCRYLKSREFIEWCYHPDNIGGKQAKKTITVFTEKINTIN